MPDAITYTSVIAACAKGGETGGAARALQFLEPPSPTTLPLGRNVAVCHLWQANTRSLTQHPRAHHTHVRGSFWMVLLPSNDESRCPRQPDNFPPKKHFSPFRLPFGSLVDASPHLSGFTDGPTGILFCSKCTKQPSKFPSKKHFSPEPLPTWRATIYIFGNNTFAAWDISILDMFNVDMVCVREKFG